MCLEILFCIRGGEIFVTTRKRDDGSWGLIPDQNRRIDEVRDDGTITFHHTEEIPVDELVEAFESCAITIDAESGIITNVAIDVHYVNRTKKILEQNMIHLTIDSNSTGSFNEWIDRNLFGVMENYPAFRTV